MLQHQTCSSRPTSAKQAAEQASLSPCSRSLQRLLTLQSWHGVQVTPARASRRPSSRTIQPWCILWPTTGWSAQMRSWRPRVSYSRSASIAESGLVIELLCDALVACSLRSSTLCRYWLGLKL